MQRPAMNAPISRRHLLKTASCGFGYLSLAAMCTEAAAATSNPLAARPAHFKSRAKRVIFVFMRGGPSHVDTFDYKPRLTIDAGKPSENDPRRTWLPSPWAFKQHGASGQWISELFPNVATHADDMCILNSLHTDLPNHPQAIIQMHTGSFQFVRPSMGSWVLYGLGTENESLPGFVTINPTSRLGGTQNYGNAFLPAPYQGLRIGNEGERVADAKIDHIENEFLRRRQQREQLGLLDWFNRERLAQDEVNPELEGVIKSYELAFRMQSSVPAIMDLTTESAATLSAYGVGGKATDDFGRQCLLARRFAEAGVRFIEIAAPSNWDHHNSLRARLTQSCEQIDQPIAAMLSDLKSRGLLDETLVICGGEFGRTPHARSADGRDHNATGFSMWMAGGGIRGGMRYGQTDEHGVEAVQDKVHIHDLHATILHLLGLDHERLTYRYSGRDFRLTDVYGRVVKEIIA